MLNIIQIWVSLNSFYTMAALPVEELSMNLGFTPFLCCTRIAWLPIHCTQEEIYYWFRQSCCIFLSQDHMMLAQHFKVHQYGINFIDIIKWDTKVNVSVLCINHRIILTHQLQHVLHLLFSTPLLHCTYIYIPISGVTFLPPLLFASVVIQPPHNLLFSPEAGAWYVHQHWPLLSPADEAPPGVSMAGRQQWTGKAGKEVLRVVLAAQEDACNVLQEKTLLNAWSFALNESCILHLRLHQQIFEINEGLLFDFCLSSSLTLFFFFVFKTIICGQQLQTFFHFVLNLI